MFGKYECLIYSFRSVSSGVDNRFYRTRKSEYTAWGQVQVQGVILPRFSGVNGLSEAILTRNNVQHWLKYTASSSPPLTMCLSLPFAIRFPFYHSHASTISTFSTRCGRSRQRCCRYSQTFGLPYSFSPRYKEAVDLLLLDARWILPVFEEGRSIFLSCCCVATMKYVVINRLSVLSR